MPILECVRNKLFKEEKMTYVTAIPPSSNHGQMTWESQKFHRYPSHSSNQYYNSSSNYHRSHRSNNRSQHRARRHPSSCDTHCRRAGNGRAFHTGRFRKMNPRKNALPLYQTAHYTAHPPVHRHQSWVSPSNAHTISSSLPQHIGQSSDGSGSSDAGSKTYLNNYSCVEQDYWYKTIEQENQALKEEKTKKKQKINELIIRAEKQKHKIVELEKQLMEAKSTAKKQAILLSEERTQLSKAKIEYSRGVKKFQNLSNNLIQKNLVLKQKHEKLRSENKHLNDELVEIKDKLKNSEALLAKQKEKLSGWGSNFNLASREAESNCDISKKGEDSKEGNRLPHLIIEGQPIVNPQRLILKNLLSRQESTDQTVAKNGPNRQLRDQLKLSIPIHPDKSPLRQIFEPGLRLFNPKDLHIPDIIGEPNKSESSEGDKDNPSDEEVDFWLLPNPPAVIDVEKWMQDHEQVPWGDQSCETQSGQISQAGTPNSVSCK